jgi:predicted Fe-Mo cluster-binding NifX family protein
MSCYFRRMKDVLSEAGIEVTAANKKQVDQALHQIVGVTYKDCPAAWKALKQQMLADENKRQELIDNLSESIGR